MPDDNMTTEPPVPGLGLEQQSLPAPVDDDLDSLASQEDSLPIWIDGEEHWISGVDANTTCADLICALLSYRSAQQQQMYRQEGLKSDRPVPVQAPQEYAIVQKQRHYEEYLDGSARLCDVISSRHALPKEEEVRERSIDRSIARPKLNVSHPRFRTVPAPAPPFGHHHDPQAYPDDGQGQWHGQSSG